MGLRDGSEEGGPLPEGADLEIERPKRSFALSAPRFRMMFDDLEPAVERVQLED